jgi:hypothetical protein
MNHNCPETAVQVRRIVALLDMARPEDIYLEDEAAGVVSGKYTMHGAKNTLWDQHTLNDVVETSVSGLESRRRSYSISLCNEDRDKWFKHHDYHTRDVSWVDDQVRSSVPTATAKRCEPFGHGATGNAPSLIDGENPKLSSRTCTPEYGLQSRRRELAGVA